MAGYLLRDVLRYALLDLTVWQFFPSGRNPILLIWKSPVAIPLFVLLHSGSPRRFPLAPLEVIGYFLYFLLGLLVLVASALFLIFFSCPFLSNCLNLPLTVLMHLEGSVPPGGCWGSWLFFFNLLPWVSFPSWCFFFWASSLLGLSFLFLSWSPCTCVLGLGLFSFGLGSLLWAWALWSF